jgi:mevalonate kinase
VDLVVLDSGSREGCGGLIKQVGEFREKNPGPWQAMTQAVIALADSCEKALTSGDAATVGKTLREAHGILSELGLSSPSIDSIINDGAVRGALGGKVSGAGGGGAVVLAARKGEGRGLANSMREAGWHVVAVVGADGAGGRRGQ